MEPLLTDISQNIATSAPTTIESFFAAFLGLALVFGIIALVLAILGSIGLAKINNNINTKGGWMAWLPIFNMYLLGKVAISKLFGWCLVLAMFLSSTYTTTINGDVSQGSILPDPFSKIASYVFALLVLVSLYKIYSKLSSKAVIMTVFTVLSCGLLAPIFLFAIRNNQVIVKEVI